MAALGGAATAAIKFESSFAGVRKTVAGSETELQALGIEFRELATRMPLSADAINAVGEAAGALGIRKDNIVAFTETMVKLGATTNLSADEAATAMARFSNIMGEPQENVANLGAALVALGNDGASTEREIVDMALRIAGAGKTVGMSSGDVMGLANALSSVGIEAEMGGSAISKVMINIAAAASQGGEAVSQFARVAGMTSEAFANLVKTDPGAALTRFIQGLGNVKRSGGDLLGTLRDLDITETRMRDTMLRVANAGDLVTDSMRLGNRAYQERSALDKEFAERQKTTAAQLQVLWNQINDVAIELGGHLIPIMKDGIAAAKPMIAWIGDAVKWFGALPQPVKTATFAVAGLVAAIGPLVFIAGTLISSIASVAGALALIAPAGVAAATGASTATLAITSLATGLARMGMAALAATPQLAALAIAAGSVYMAGQAFRHGYELIRESSERSAGEAIEAQRQFQMISKASHLAGREIKTYAEAVAIVTAHVREQNQAIHDGVVMYKEAAGPVNNLVAEHRNLATQLAEVKRKVAALAPDQRANIKAGLEMGLSVKEVAGQLNLAEPVVDMYSDALKRSESAARKAAEAQKKFLESIRPLNREFVPLVAGVKDAGTELQNIARGLEGNGNLISRSLHEAGLAAAEADAATKEWADTTGGALPTAVKSAKTEITDATEKTRTWGDTLRDLSESFRNLAEISGGTFGGVVQWIGSVIASVDLAHRSATTFRDGWKERGSIDGIAKMAAGIIGIVGALDQATSTASRLKNTLGGAMVGAQAGSQIGAMFGPIGQAVGAAIGGAVGAITGLLRRPAFADIMKRVGHDWGVSISEGLAKEIADTAKKLFRGDRQAAEIFNLDRIMAEAGGPKPETLAKWTSKLRDAFSMVDMGKFTREQAASVLDKNFQALVDVAKKHKGLITAELREIMALDESFGTRSATIAEHVKTSLGAGLGHLTTFLKLSADAAKTNIADIQKEMKAIDEERDKLLGRALSSDEQKRADELDKKWDELKKKAETAKQLQAALTITNTASANAFAAAISGSFQKLIAAGVDPLAAIDQVTPAVEALQGQLDTLGIDGGDAFVALRAQIAMTRDEVAGPMVQGMRAVGSAITELYNGGVLTSDMFVGMAGQIGQTFQALVKQGHNGTTAMMLMKPQLQQIWELQQRFGVAVDEATQQLLDEAEAAGLVGDAHKSASERMVDGIGKVVDRLDALLEGMGIKLPQAVGQAAAAITGGMETSANALEQVLSKIPRRIPVDIIFNVDDPDLERNRPQPVGSGVEIPGAAAGVFATRPMIRIFGEGGEPELGGPVSFMTQALTGALEQVGANAGPGGMTFEFHVTTLNADGLRTAVERDIIPMITDAIGANRRQARTDFRTKLGIA